MLKTAPQNRSEQEIAGYRDVLNTIHANHNAILFRAGVVLQFHRAVYQFLPTRPQPKIVQARSLLCYWATSELGISQARMSQKLGISQAALSLSVSRGRRIALEHHYEIGNL